MLVCEFSARSYLTQVSLQSYARPGLVHLTICFFPDRDRENIYVPRYGHIVHCTVDLYDLEYHVFLRIYCVSHQILAIYCTATNTITTHSRDIERNEPKRQDIGLDITIPRQIVWPQDRKDKVTNSKTENLLEELTQQKNIFSYKDSSQNPVYWLVNVTDSQVDTIKKNAGPCFLLFFPRTCTTESLDMAGWISPVSSEAQC